MKENGKRILSKTRIEDTANSAKWLEPYGTILSKGINQAQEDFDISDEEMLKFLEAFPMLWESAYVRR
jgi:hypothetical protein